MIHRISQLKRHNMSYEPNWQNFADIELDYQQRNLPLSASFAAELDQAVRDLPEVSEHSAEAANIGVAFGRRIGYLAMRRVELLEVRLKSLQDRIG